MNAGVDSAVVMQITGHQTVRNFREYVNHDERVLRAAMQMIHGDLSPQIKADRAT